jgi:hypothetical protein
MAMEFVGLRFGQSTILRINMLHHGRSCAEVTNVKSRHRFSESLARASVMPTLRKTGEGWASIVVVTPGA